MAEMSMRFNWDDFDEQIREALVENYDAMTEAGLAVSGLDKVLRPGEIGAVPAVPTLTIANPEN